MNLSDIRAEVQARGFDYVSPTSRIDRWVNTVYQRICDREAWPFLETTTSGTAPLTISDFRAALSVVDTTNDLPLVWEDIRTLREADPDLSQTGTPELWYFDGSALNVYPVNTSDTISVRYLKVPTDLSADGDIPLLPARYHYILVDAAVAEAYKDSDNFETYGALLPYVEAALGDMGAALLVQNYDSLASVVGYGNSTDW